MANLKRKFTWRKWAPDIGENRELEGGPVLFLEIATGLTGRQIAEIGEALQPLRTLPFVKPTVKKGATVESIGKMFQAAMKAFLTDIRVKLGKAFEPYVRVHGGPHTVDGEQLATLDDYLKLIEDAGDYGKHARTELEAALFRFNSIEGPDELFSLRSSGGARSTDAQRTAKGERKTASP